MNAKTGEYICAKCGISYYPEHQQLKSGTRLVAHDGPNEEPAVSYTPEPLYGKKPRQIKGTFAEMAKKGIKIKDYKETDGAGREIR